MQTILHVVESSGKCTPCLNIMIGLVQLVGSAKAVCVQRSPQGAMLFCPVESHKNSEWHPGGLLSTHGSRELVVPLWHSCGIVEGKASPAWPGFSSSCGLVIKPPGFKR